MNFSLTSRSLLAVGLVLAVPLLTGANGNGCGNAVVIGNENGGSGGTSTVTCAADSCGEAAPAIARICPDGTSVGPTCGVTNGTCGWTFPCPPSTCTTAQCGAEPPTPLCSGGTTVTPTCGLTSNDTCGWTVPACPTTTCTASDCGPEPGIEVDCNGTPEGPVCEPTGTNDQCGWVIPPCPVSPQDGGASADAGECPTPKPENCNSVTECPCTDGTTQVGGCPNGFTCPQACCGHGGAK
jgi:hypothetical protein